MSFLRPTASSLNRANAAPHLSTATPTTGATISGAQPPFPPPQARQLFSRGNTDLTTDAAPADYSCVPSRVNGRLPTRTAHSGSVPRSARSRSTPGSACATATPTSASLQEFTARCESVMQRAQELLERTRDQETLVARALAERLSQSPARRAGLSPARPEAPVAPPTTPATASRVSPPRAAASPPAPQQSEGRRLGCFSFLSPQRASMPPPPPPTPASDSPTPQAPPTSARVTDAVSPSRPSLYARVLISLQRLSGTRPPAPAPSPAPLPAMTDTAPQQPSLASPSPQRKSVRFVSPDKLESVTPTRRQLDAEVELIANPQTRHGKEECHSATTTATPIDQREEEVMHPHVTWKDDVNPVPMDKTDPDAVATMKAAKAKTMVKKRQHSRSASSSRSASAVSPVTKTARLEVEDIVAELSDEDDSAKTKACGTPCGRSTRSRTASASRSASPKRSPSRRSHSDNKESVREVAPKKAAPKAANRSSCAPPAASSTSSGAVSATREHHLEMVAFIKANTVKRSLAAYTKHELMACLHAEGVPAVSPTLPKKKLLDELRALLAARR